MRKAKGNVRLSSNLNGRPLRSTHYLELPTLNLKYNTHINRKHLGREKGGNQKGKNNGLTAARKGGRQRGESYTKETKLQGARGRPNLNDGIIRGVGAAGQSNQETENYPIKTIRFHR